MVGGSEDCTLVAVLGVPLKEKLHLLSDLQHIEWWEGLKGVSLSQLHHPH